MTQQNILELAKQGNAQAIAQQTSPDAQASAMVDFIRKARYAENCIDEVPASNGLLIG